MKIELITPARGARVSLLTAMQRSFIDQAGQSESAGAQPIDFLNLNRSEGEDCSLGAGVVLAWRGTSGRCRVVLRCRAETWTFDGDAQTLTVRNLRAGERYDWSARTVRRQTAGLKRKTPCPASSLWTAIRMCAIWAAGRPPRAASGRD